VSTDWTSLFKGDVRPDFVIFVWFTAQGAPDACRIFIVPAGVVDADLRECHLHWLKYLRRDGAPPNAIKPRRIFMDGQAHRGKHRAGLCREVGEIRRRLGLAGG
jgi:hypothetical protein